MRYTVPILHDVIRIIRLLSRQSSLARHSLTPDNALDLWHLCTRTPKKDLPATTMTGTGRRHSASTRYPFIKQAGKTAHRFPMQSRGQNRNHLHTGHKRPSGHLMKLMTKNVRPWSPVGTCHRHDLPLPDDERPYVSIYRDPPACRSIVIHECNSLAQTACFLTLP